jgi:hypothetical protein
MIADNARIGEQSKKIGGTLEHLQIARFMDGRALQGSLQLTAPEPVLNPPAFAVKPDAAVAFYRVCVRQLPGGSEFLSLKAQYSAPYAFHR